MSDGDADVSTPPARSLDEAVAAFLAPDMWWEFEAMRWAPEGQALPTDIEVPW